MSSPPLSATARQKTQPTELTCVSIERLNDPHSARRYSPLIACGTRRRGVELWQVGRRGRRTSAPVLFARVPTPPSPLFVHVLSSPSGTNSWPPSKSAVEAYASAASILPSSSMLSRSLGKLGRTTKPIQIKKNRQKKSASLWAFARCHSVAYEQQLQPPRGTLVLNIHKAVRARTSVSGRFPQSVQSNGSVVLVHVSVPLHFSTKTLHHIRVFTCETGARGSPAVHSGQGY